MERNALVPQRIERTIDPITIVIFPGRFGLRFEPLHADRVNFSRHLVVDGSNILHAWPELKSLLKRDRAAARAQLVQQLAAIHDVDTIRVTVVFDGRGDEIVIERPSEQMTFSVVYTPSSLTADDVIEQMVAKSTPVTSCVVATDDAAERETIRATGAEVLGASDLASWVKRATSRLGSLIKARQAANTRDWQRP